MGNEAEVRENQLKCYFCGGEIKNLYGQINKLSKSVN